MFTQSRGGIKSGSVNEDFTDAGRARLLPAADFVTAGWAAATPVPLSQTAPGSAAALSARMNGLGPRPLPSAIAAIVRPGAMGRSSTSTANPSASRECSSLRLISNQLTRLRSVRTGFIRTNTQFPRRRSPLQREPEAALCQTLLQRLSFNRAADSRGPIAARCPRHIPRRELFLRNRRNRAGDPRPAPPDPAMVPWSRPQDLNTSSNSRPRS
jgi:hypothetical protein